MDRVVADGNHIRTGARPWRVEAGTTGAFHPQPREAAPPARGSHAFVVPATVVLLLLGHGLAMAVAGRSRTRAGARGRPLRPRPARPLQPPDRHEAWLAELRHELSGRWCAVRVGSPGVPWDLEVAVGMLLRCRLRSAAHREWHPVARTSLRVSGVGAAFGVLSLAGLPVAPYLALGLLGALLITATLEAVALTRLTSRAVSRSTRATTAPEDGPRQRRPAPTTARANDDPR